jgi:exoribonuclease R
MKDERDIRITEQVRKMISTIPPEVSDYTKTDARILAVIDSLCNVIDQQARIIYESERDIVDMQESIDFLSHPK